MGLAYLHPIHVQFLIRLWEFHGLQPTLMTTRGTCHINMVPLLIFEHNKYPFHLLNNSTNVPRHYNNSPSMS